MVICDLTVISGICETAGEAAASLVSAPFDWLPHAMGSAAGWLFESVWNVFDAIILVDITSDVQPAVRHRDVRDAAVLLPPAHHRPHQM
ncbi:hypothetical protein [uncultured Tessaracoccus sp.]|uniref:hypothetical protein n=1 Tax=uncultured Tessaracoccus sp. TaxID=905023 RepID=UPI002625AFD0|nr:hypothetical protein [uncultured Tessaracoccus sp.]